MPASLLSHQKPTLATQPGEQLLYVDLSRERLEQMFPESP
jgi:hypothetical protein